MRSRPIRHLARVGFEFMYDSISWITSFVQTFLILSITVYSQNFAFLFNLQSGPTPKRKEVVKERKEKEKQEDKIKTRCPANQDENREKKEQRANLGPQLLVCAEASTASFYFHP